MTRARVVCVCLLLVVAGCNASPFGDGGDATPASTAATTEPGTSEAAPTTNGGGGDLSRPPGVSGEGVNASALLDAHLASLDGESFTVALPNGPDGRGPELTVRAGPADAVRVEQALGSGGSAGLFVDGARAYWETAGGGPHDDVVTNWSATRDYAARTWYAVPPTLDHVLAADGGAVPAPDLALDGTVARAGRTLWRLDVRPSDRTRAAGFETVNGSVLVTEAGRVVSVTYEYGSGTSSATLSYRLSAVGETAVDRPDWVADAHRHGDYRGFGPAQRRITEPVPMDRGLVTLVGVPADADHRSVDISPVATSDDLLTDAVVGWYTYVEPTTDYDHAFVTLAYNESLVPSNGSESELGLYRFSQTDAEFVRVDGSPDADENEVSARVDDATGMFVVFHAPTFERLRENATA